MEVDCNYGTLIKYSCFVTSAVIAEPNTKIGTFRGFHWPGKANKDVEEVYFRCNGLEYVPRGLSSIFIHLTVLSINSCGLKAISQKDLSGLENLTELDIRNNKLTSLPDNLFAKMGKMKRISCSDNKLEFMSSQLLKPILANGLTCVDFRRNTKIDAFYDSGIHFDPRCVRSLEKLMKLIDKKCTRPIKEPREDKACELKFPENPFKDLWTTGRYSDFTFTVGAKEFHLHRNILGTQSSVFAEIFDNEMQGRNEIELKIQDSKANAVDDFLRYFYTGEIGNEANALEVFDLAAKFNVQKLKATCERKVLKKVNESNALEVFTLGHLHGSNVMKRKAFAEIKKMFPEFKLDADLINQPDKLKKLIEAKLKRNKIVEEADRAFALKAQKLKKK